MAKKRMNDKNNQLCAQLRERYRDEIEDTPIPDALDPARLDQLINPHAKTEGADTNKKVKPKITPYRCLALAASLLLVLGIGIFGITKVNNSIRMQTDDLTEMLLTEGTGTLSLAEKCGVAANDYTPLYNYFNAQLQQYKTKSQFNLSDLWGAEWAVDTAETAETSGEASGYSTTNNQVEDVEEGDILKTDGSYLYALTGWDTLSCSRILSDGTLETTASLSLSELAEGTDLTVLEMYLYEDQLAVICQCWDYETDVTVLVLLFDCGEGNLSLRDSYQQTGTYRSSRETDGALYLITSSYLNFSDPEDSLPLIWEGEDERKISTDEIYVTACSSESMCSITLTGYAFGADVDSLQIVSAFGSSATEIYCTSENLYLLCNRWDDGDGSTRLYRYALDHGKITAAAEGEVTGTTLNQFSADEADGYLRIATTDSKACRVTVLDASLQMVSELTGLAEGEDIYACRFIGDTAYLVTFYQTDPLFVLDLSDPTDLKLTGSLELPGYSAYLHPVGENYLIGIGENADEEGVTDGLRINLFDISDPTQPKLVDYKVLSGNSYSLVSQTHKAFYYDAQNGIFGLPICLYHSNNDNFNGYVLFDCSGGKLEIAKELDFVSHSGNLDWSGNADEIEDSANGFLIQRGAYVGDTLYLLSNRGIYAYGRTDFAYLNYFDLD